MNIKRKICNSKKKLNICLVCSSGGHLIQCYNLSSWWEKYKHFWITFDKIDAKSILSTEKDVIYGFYPTNRNIFNLFRNLILAFKVLTKKRPNVIFSTGAGIAIPFFLIGKIIGAKLIYLEVYDRIDSPTITGKVLYPIVDLFLIQWKEQKKYYPKARLWGQAL